MAVSYWCAGARCMDSARLLQFCELTGCSPEWLMLYEPVDIQSIARAPDGVHAKELVRAVIEEMASDGVLRVAAVSGE